MDYVITVGKNYIGYDKRGKMVEVNDLGLALKAPMHKLTNFINNCIAPDMRKKCKVVNVDSLDVKHVITPTIKSEATEHQLFDEIFTKLKSLGSANFQQEHDELSQQLSRIDQEVCDIQHYIEFNKLNAAEGYKAYKLLQDKLLERRVIKDNQQKFQMLSSAKVSDIFDGTLDKNLKDLSSRTYTPRVLKELF